MVSIGSADIRLFINYQTIIFKPLYPHINQKKNLALKILKFDCNFL